MATVRKRALPSGKTAWLAGYVDGAGKRRFKQFVTRKEADAFLLRARSEVSAGNHVPEREARTVGHAYGLLLATLTSEGAARATRHNYEVYYRNHVGPLLGSRLLPKIGPADVGDWLRDLRVAGRTDDTCRRARIVLGAVYDETIRRRLAFANPVRLLRERRKTRRAEILETLEGDCAHSRTGCRAGAARGGRRSRFRASHCARS